MKNKYFLYSVILFAVFVFGIFIFKMNEKKEVTYNDLVNVSDLPEEFMQDYFEETKKLQENNNEENILIVTSLNGIPDSYGATNVVVAPNNQFFLQYQNEEDKEKALQNFKKDDSIYSVGENVIYEIEVSDINNNDETFALNNYSIETTTYNSWGIEAMGIDHVFSQVNNLSNISLNSVNVAIIDTGLDVDLFNKYYENKIFETYNVLDNSFDENDMYDNNGHGTHIAGTIAEGTPNNVKIIPIKVSDDGHLSDVNIITAINYIVYYKKADVINMSFGGYENDTELANAINSANSNNIICVAAAGNDNTSTPHYPSALNTTISVASIDSNLNKSSFSNYNLTVDFAAPGTSIKSIMGKNAAISQSNGNNDDDEHEIINGTSMATPHVVSAVAILKSFNKDLTISDTKSLLRKNSIDLGDDGKDKYFGYGFVTFSQTTFCDGGSCDNYNVYNNSDELGITKIEMVNQGINHIHSNYGNITDLLELEINIYFNNDFYITKKLADLDGLVIEGYDITFDKDQYGNMLGTKTQEVTIQYRGKSTTATVMTYSVSGSAWEYEVIDDDNIRIVGFSVSVATNHPSTIYIPETIGDYNVLEIKANAFKNNSKLSKVFLPSTIKKIGSEAFYNNVNLSRISSLENIEVIGENAFKNTNLEDVEFGVSLTSIGTSAFENTKITNVYIPKTVNFIGIGAFAGCNNIETIVVDDENNIYDSRNNSNAIIETSSNTLIKGNYNTNLTNDIEVIGEKAFYNDTRIENISIPNSVTSINYFAFAFDSNLIDSKLNKVTILRNVTEIATNAFNENNKNILIYTYSDAVAKEYAVLRKLPYETMNYSSVNANLDNYTFNAFDSLSGVFNLRVNYNIGYYVNNNYYYDSVKVVNLFKDDISNLDTNKYHITYIDNRDSFRYGDRYATITGKDEYGNDFEEKIFVIIYKATPTYEIPNNITARVGQSLESVTLPSNFEWMDSTIILSEEGNQVFKARYIPTDTQNYKTVENIDISVSVNNVKNIIIPNIQISNKIYDGTTNLDFNSITISNLNNNDYTVQSATLEDSNVGNSTATIVLRLSNEKFNDYMFEDGNQEKEFIVKFQIIPQKLIKPTKVEKIYTYNGEEQTIELNNFDSSKMNIEGNARTNSGEQNVIISLKNSNYIWDDNTTNNIILKFKINKAEIVVQDGTSNAIFKYDNLPHTLSLNLNDNDSFIIRFMNNNEEYILNECPSYKDVGVYNIKYKVYIDENYTEYFGEKTITISREKHTITFYANNGTEDNVEQEVEDSFNTPLRKNTFTKDNFKFKEWNTQADGKGISYEDEKVIAINANLTLYAIWNEELDYVINNYSVDEMNKYISKIMVNTQINSFIINFSLGYGYGIDVDYKAIDNKQVLYTGGKTRIINGSYLYAEYTNIVIGDINGDGVINSADLLKIRQHLLKINILSGAYFLSSDINYDSLINSADLLRVRQHLLGSKYIE